MPVRRKTRATRSRPAAPTALAPATIRAAELWPARRRPLYGARSEWPGRNRPQRSASSSPCASLVDQRTRALIREQLQQYRMLHLAVDDDDALHALLQRIDAGLDLRDHAAGDGAVGDQLAGILDRQLRNQLLR